MKSKWSKILDKKVDTQYSPTASDWSSMQTILDGKAGASSWWSFSKIAALFMIPIIAVGIYFGVSETPPTEEKLDSNIESIMESSEKPANTPPEKVESNLQEEKVSQIDQENTDQSSESIAAPEKDIESEKPIASEKMNKVVSQEKDTVKGEFENDNPIMAENSPEVSLMQSSSGSEDDINKETTTEDPQASLDKIENQDGDDLDNIASADSPEDENVQEDAVEQNQDKSATEALEDENTLPPSQEEDNGPQAELNNTGLKISDFKLAALELRGAYGYDLKKDYLFSVNGGVELALSYQGKWNLNTGIQYSNWWEKSKEEINSTTSYDTTFASRVDTSISYYIDSNWVVSGQGQGGRVYDTIYYFQTDTIQEALIDSAIVSTRDQLPKLQLISRVSVPLLFSYNANYKKVRLELALGPIFNFSKYSTNKFEEELSTFSMDIAIRPTLSYRISSSFDIMAFADYRSQLSGETDLFIPDSRLNYGLGLRFNFK